MSKAKDVSQKDEAATGPQAAPAKPEEGLQHESAPASSGAAEARARAADEDEDDSPRRGRRLRATSRMVHTHPDGTEEVLEAGETCGVNSMFAKLHPHMFEMA